jgi:hypothetical protein
MWPGDKSGLVGAVLASAVLFVPCRALCALQTRIELRIGDAPHRVTRYSPALKRYLVEIRKEVQAAEQLARDFEKEMEKCARDNARA